MYKYSARFKPAEEGGYVITFPNIPEIATQAETPDDALLMATDALELALAGYMKRRLPIPVPSAEPGKEFVTVSLPALIDAKVALYETMRKRGREKADIAIALGWQPSQMDRLLDLRHRSRMEDIEAALRILGSTLEIQVTDKTMVAR
jgi:antitoxin HicB